MSSLRLIVIRYEKNIVSRDCLSLHFLDYCSKVQTEDLQYLELEIFVVCRMVFFLYLSAMNLLEVAGTFVGLGLVTVSSPITGFSVVGDWIIIQPSGVVIGDHTGTVASE